jgi:hypothetical protein
MRVRLSGASDEFRIEQKSEEEQLIGGDPTEWLFIVTPLKSGARRRLHLSAVALVSMGEKDVSREFPAYDTDIHVKVNWPYLISSNWKEITGGITATTVLGWIGVIFEKRRRKRRAGFI